MLFIHPQFKKISNDIINAFQQTGSLADKNAVLMLLFEFSAATIAERRIDIVLAEASPLKLSIITTLNAFDSLLKKHPEPLLKFYLAHLIFEIVESIIVANLVTLNGPQFLQLLNNERIRNLFLFFFSRFEFEPFEFGINFQPGSMTVSLDKTVFDPIDKLDSESFRRLMQEHADEFITDQLAQINNSVSRGNPTIPNRHNDRGVFNRPYFNEQFYELIESEEDLMADEYVAIRETIYKMYTDAQTRKLDLAKDEIQEILSHYGTAVRTETEHHYLFEITDFSPTLFSRFLYENPAKYFMQAFKCQKPWTQLKNKHFEHETEVSEAIYKSMDNLAPYCKGIELTTRETKKLTGQGMVHRYFIQVNSFKPSQFTSFAALNVAEQSKILSTLSPNTKWQYYPHSMIYTSNNLTHLMTTTDSQGFHDACFDLVYNEPNGVVIGVRFNVERKLQHIESKEIAEKLEQLATSAPKAQTGQLHKISRLTAVGIVKKADIKTPGLKRDLIGFFSEKVVAQGLQADDEKEGIYQTNKRLKAMAEENISESHFFDKLELEKTDEGYFILPKP